MKRLILCLLALSLLTGLIQPAFATEPVEETAAPETESMETVPVEETAETALPASAEQTDDLLQPCTYESLTTSEAGLAFIKEMMGSYTTSSLTAAESTVNSFAASSGLTLSQPQFDALVDLVMAYGSFILTSGYRVQTVIASGSYTDVELADAFCSWVKDGTSFSQERLNRRLRELKLFLYGSYDGSYDATFRYVIYNANGGTLDDNTVLCYAVGAPYTALPTASRSGQYFAGWFTAATGGAHVSNATVVSADLTLYAHWSSTEVETPNEEGCGGGDTDVPELKVTEALVQFIKDNEGFCKYPIYDYGQYSVGYGSRVPDGMLSHYLTYGITEEEADYLLRLMLVDMEAMVDKFLAKATVTHSQNEYDAIVSFTYNLGSQWMDEDYLIAQYFLHGGYTELEFINAIGSWCSAGGSVLPGLVRRRIDEADMYLNGSYTKGSTTYLGVELKTMGGTTAKKCAYFISGQPMGNMPVATRSGYELVGWFTKSTGGTQYTSETVAPRYGYYTLYAQWVVSEDDDDDNNGGTGDDNNTGGSGNGSSGGSSGASGVFTDVSEKVWYYDYVYQAVSRGLFSGMGDTEFGPELPMTRAMMVAVLYRMSGDTETYEHPFTDVADGAWYADAVAWGYGTGIVSGMSETSFGVNYNITREQLTALLYRFAKHYGMDTTARADLSVFPDSGSVSGYAQEAMQWAVAVGIISGSGGNLLPKGNATRAQCARMLVTYQDATVPAPISEEPTEETVTEP